MKTYSEKLRDPRWQKMRLQVLQRDEWACQLCFDTQSTLHVHHRFYEKGKEPWDYPLGALVTLCESCHEEDGASCVEQERYMLQTMKLLGAGAAEFNAIGQCFEVLLPEKLVEPDWTMIEWVLCRIFRGRDGNDGLWKQLHDEYREHIRQLAAKITEQNEKNKK